MRDRIAAELAPVTPKYLRELLRESGVPLAPLVEGVRQDSFENLDRTLSALAAAYGSGNADQRQACRRLVIEAKDHARFALRKGSLDKEETIRWILVWLENPGVFPTWARLRMRARRESRE